MNCGAIERPAQLAGDEFEPGLVDVLLEEVKNRPGALPLLEYTLQELWNRRKGPRLTHAALREIGHVRGALQQHADKMYSTFTDAEQEICKHIFLRLVQSVGASRYTSRRAPVEEFLAVTVSGMRLRKRLGLSDNSPDVQRVLNALTGESSRLIIITRPSQSEAGDFVEIAHEALIESWSKLREWLDADQEFQRWLRRLRDVIAAWQTANRDEAALLRGILLDEGLKRSAERPTDVSAEETAYMAVSYKQRQQEEEREAQRKAAFEAEQRAA